LVASLISANNPKRHIDVGSRIDGFVAHVASFREIEVLDVRELKDTRHQNIKFLKANLMDESAFESNITDSISCLHAIEHFGLGRYGDPIDPFGHLRGFKNMVRMLKAGGTMYVSFPIGLSNEIHFNAHRVFHPLDIFSWLENDNSLEINRFDYVDDDGSLHINSLKSINEIKVNYGCGIYTFTKIN
jgi:DNA modification methylase